MRTILLPFHDEDAGRTALDAATLVARRFGSYLEGLLVLEGAQHLTFDRRMPVPAEYLEQMVREWREFADSARAHFLTITREEGIAPGELESAGQGPVAGWREVDGRESEVVAEHGRLFDLIVLGRTTPHKHTRWQATCEAALFESGRPVLLAPALPPKSIGELVVIAWNGSTETARSVALAMPLLTAASCVVVLSVEGWMIPGPSGRDMTNHLVRNGVPAEAETVSMSGRTAGEAILEKCRDIQADLLVKGAYTHSRLRQVIFGGATEHVMKHAELPVLLAH
jgi:nucleotide-binding universal stress UspA family protein